MITKRLDGSTDMSDAEATIRFTIFNALVDLTPRAPFNREFWHQEVAKATEAIFQALFGENSPTVWATVDYYNEQISLRDPTED